MSLNFDKALADQLMRGVIQRVAVGPDRGRDIPADEIAKLMIAILSGQMDEVQVAVFLIALRMKRESLEEFCGIFTALQGTIKPQIAAVDELVCLADPFDGYTRHHSMTPFIPAVLAACGMPAIMHGVETVGPKHGVTACKVYQLAGIDTKQSSAKVADALPELLWGYLDQSQYAPLLFSLNKLRDRLVKRTALTTLERVLMPIKSQGATHLVLGYVHKAYPEIYTRVAQQAGYATTLLIKGLEGGLAPALNKPLRRYFINQSDVFNDDKEIYDIEPLFNRDTAAVKRLESDEPVCSKAIEKTLDFGLDTLKGKSGIARDSLCLASAQILYAHQRSNSLNAAVEKVQHCLDNGRAQAYFNATHI